MRKLFLYGLLVILSISVYACESPKPELIKSWPLDSAEGVLDAEKVELDKDVTNDGHGSLRITAEKNTRVSLYQTEVDLEDAQLIYSAMLRTENIQGKAYLEMWCFFEGKGEFFSRALHAPLMADTDWTEQQTPFFLKEGENPDQVRLNLVIEGKGTIWIDDIRLLKAPL